jgi:hypothetical protein
MKLTCILLILCLGLRFVPLINDRLSGPFAPMRALAQQFAKTSATATGEQYPILVTQAENLNCQNAQHTISTDYDAVLYLITYSEKSRSVCLTTYAHFPNGDNLPNSTMLSETIGHNYGHPLAAPLRAIPIENRLTTYPAQYLSLLHWRTKVVFPLAHAEQLNARTRQFAPNGESTNLDLELGFQDLRSAVAERHDAVNHLLSLTLASESLLLIILTGLLWEIFRRLLWYGRSCDFVVSPRMFLLEDLPAIAARARRHHLVQQQEIQERLRAENALKQSINEARERLQLLLVNVSDESFRAEIINCLEGNRLEEMTALFQRYQTQAGQKTQDERLSLLLESLKPLCTLEEFEGYREQAFTQLQESGFRQAREFAVKTHEQLRERLKKSTEETSSEDLEDTA